MSLRRSRERPDATFRAPVRRSLKQSVMFGQHAFVVVGYLVHGPLAATLAEPTHQRILLQVPRSDAVPVPNITNLFHGREAGYAIERLLGEPIEAISAARSRSLSAVS